MNRFIIPLSRFYLLSTLLLLLSCESPAQTDNSNDSGNRSRRTVPESVKQTLPKKADTLRTTKHYRLLAHGKVNMDDALGIGIKSEKQLSRLLTFLSRTEATGIVNWHLYPTSEIKGLLLQNTTPCHIDFEAREIHFVLNDAMKDHYLGAELSLFLRELLGKPELEILEAGLAVYFTEDWQRLGYLEWADRLHKADKIPSLKHLLDDQLHSHCSDLVFTASSAALCEFLIEKWGRDTFLDRYKNWESDPTELSALEAEWKAYLDERPLAKRDIRPANEPLTLSLPYLKGFNFAHEGYRIYNGYGSRKAEQSLQRLRQMGVNTVAIVPYSFIREPKEPNIIPVVRRTGTENDESVIQSAEDAQRAGMLVVIKPQIWLGGSHWTGDIEMRSEADWKTFFACYGHWITHYAMLAEIYDWDLLCIGNELVRTTLLREYDWRHLTRSLRHIYSGPLTYAANWGDEFENIGLWEELDYIGLNCYYPLSQKDEPSDRDLKKGFNDVIQKIEKVLQKHNKPLLFTEIGFPNIEAPWKKPHDDWGDFEPNPHHQERCYEIVFSSLKDKSWCKGILWWKYPTDLDHRRRRNTGFSPHGKAAEEVVARWFGTNQ